MSVDDGCRPGSSTLIHDLPNEILVFLFLFALRPLDPQTHYKTLHTILCVCQKWRGIVMESAVLWYLVTAGGHAPSLATILSKSRNQPLVIVDHNMGTPENDEALLDQIHRWKAATIRLPPVDAIRGFRDQWRMWNRPAPLVEDANLIGHPTDHRNYATGINLFGGRAPKLQSLRLEGCWVALVSPVFHGLQRLELCNVQLEGIMPSVFTRLLDDCKSLKVLHLNGCEFDLRGWEEDQMEPGVVVLSELTSISLREIGFAAMFFFLRVIQLPQCTSMKLSYHALNLDEAPEVPFAHWIIGAMPTIKKILASAYQLVIAVRDDDDLSLCLSAISQGLNTFQLHIYDDNSPDLSFGFLVTSWALSELKTPITLLICWPTDSFDHIAHILGHLPSTTKLVLLECSEPFVLALQGLHNPRLVWGRYSWACPNLEEILFLDCPDCPIESVADILEHRCGDKYEVPENAPTDSPSTPPRPKCIKRIGLRGVEEDEANAELLAQALAPGGRLVYESDAEPSLSLELSDLLEVIDDVSL